MNTETALIVGLVLALMVVASVYAAASGTIDIAHRTFDDISGQEDVGEVTPSSYQNQGEEERGEVPWTGKKEPRLSQL